MNLEASYSISALDTIGVTATNSPGYVEVMLANLVSGRVSVPLRGPDDKERLEATATTEVITPVGGTGWLGLPFTSTDGDTPAQISFTSGTEGMPKGVLLSRGNLHDVVTRLINIMEIASEIREYIGVPVYHSFGYARARTVLHAGGDGFIPARGFDLAEIRRMLQANEINAISAVPSLWRIFLDNLDMFGVELEAVRWVEIGSQYMSGAEKAALRDALPNARIVQHYGLTEASRTTFLRVHAEPTVALESVGRPEDEVNVRINTENRIEIRGPHVALGILDGTKYHAISPDMWFETSDHGRLEDGLLYYDGRADDVINCGGIKLSPDLVETHVRQTVPNAGNFGVLRTADALRGESILLALAPDAATQAGAMVEAIHQYATESGLVARDAIQVREVSDLPRTPTGKLQRKQLASMLAEQPKATPEQRDAPQAPSSFLDLLKQLFGARFDPEAAFNDLEGDSLVHMQLTLALERALESVPEHWEWLPLGQLAAGVDKQGDFNALMASGSSGAPPLPDGSRNMNPSDISFFALVVEDFRTNDSSVFHQGFLMLLIHRFGNLRMSIRWKILRILPTLAYRVLNKLTQILFGMKLDYTVQVGRRVKLEHFGGMILGAREIGNDVWIRQNTTFGIRSVEDVHAKPTIGNSVDIGAGAVIVGSTTIGDNSIIGANTVVFSNVPPNSVVMGVPGKVIGTNPRRNRSPLDSKRG